ncbi:MAG: septum formation initiator family protein [Kofleriaceae bacterium]|nr:septum formation initiator family protein [Kofleriaceae bacterium]MCB9573721.1 septum formation initiator family protein [Kofleriaceae bacterium]
MRKVLADMHVPPAWRRWLSRAAVALVIALVVAWVPWRASAGDRIERLRAQLAQTRDESAELEQANAHLEREIRGLRSDPEIIEEHARDELGMVYPGELVIRVQGSPDDAAAATPTPAATPAVAPEATP